VPSLVFATAALAADLDDLRATQQKLLAARDNKDPWRDNVPLEQVGIVKRQLLTWAESKLQRAGGDVDTAALSNELHTAIQLTPEDAPDRLGDLDLSFSRLNGESAWLQMTTDVGIPCGFDRSLYLYEWRDNRWNRRFVLEASDYRKAQYRPQESVELKVSALDVRGARLVLVTGTPPACVSVWHTLYIRLFRVDAAQTLLVEQTPFAVLGQDPAYSARLEPAGARIDFYGRAIDAVFLMRPYVLRYRLDNGKISQIEPIALSPLAFVDEWLSRAWAEIAAYSEPQLAARHNKLHKENVSGSYQAVQRCAKPGEWQISIDLDDETSYFSVLDRGDNRYRMLSVRENPRPDCSGANELFGPPKK